MIESWLRKSSEEREQDWEKLELKMTDQQRVWDTYVSYLGI